jgi:hypothetical protein
MPIAAAGLFGDTSGVMGRSLRYRAQKENDLGACASKSF